GAGGDPLKEVRRQLGAPRHEPFQEYSPEGAARARRADKPVLVLADGENPAVAALSHPEEREMRRSRAAREGDAVDRAHPGHRDGRRPGPVEPAILAAHHVREKTPAAHHV